MDIKKLISASLLSIGLLHGLSLEDAVRETLHTNPTVQERLYNYKQTVHDLDMADSEYLPKLNLESSFGKEYTDDENWKKAEDTDLHFYEHSLVFLYNLFDGFSTVHKSNYQESRVMAASYHFIEKSNDLAFEMTNAYIQVLKNKELLDVSSEHVIITKKYYDSVNSLFDAGLTTESDFRKVESAYALAHSNLTVQKNNLLDAISKFSKILGRKVSLSELQEIKFTTLLPKNLDNATQYAIKNNPSLLVSKYNIQASKHLLKQRRKDFYPKVDFRLEQAFNQNTDGVEADSNSLKAEIVLTYNFFNGGYDTYNKRKTISKMHQEVSIKRGLQRDVIEGLELSWSAHTMLQRQLKYLDDYKRANELVVKLYEDEYEMGTRTLLDLLSAQDSLIASKSQIVKSKYEWLFSKYRIMDSMGLLIASITGNDYDYINNVGLKKEIKEDKAEIIFDSDMDNIADNSDICLNSRSKENIGTSGCENIIDGMHVINFEPYFHSYEENSSVQSSEYLEYVKNEIREFRHKLIKVNVVAHVGKGESLVDDANRSVKLLNEVKDVLKYSGVPLSKFEMISESSQSPLYEDNGKNTRIDIAIYIKQEKNTPKLINDLLNENESNSSVEDLNNSDESDLEEELSELLE